jgi:tRNA threonylcarbamoyladenosine biosynthesis protein TsaB
VTLVGFDTSMAPAVAAVVREDGQAFCTAPPGRERLLGPPRHSAELLPALAGLLARAQRDWSDVRSVAVGVGPGTFTGLRIGVATARGLAQGLGVPLRPVSSLDALAAGLATEAEPGRALLAVIDARRAQVFAALYRAADPPQRVWGPLALSPGDLAERLTTAAEKPLAAGDWALESAPALEAAGAEVLDPESPRHAISALALCRLSEGVNPVPPERVQPTYVRLPDAEINRRNTRDETRGAGA